MRQASGGESWLLVLLLVAVAAVTGCAGNGSEDVEADAEADAEFSWPEPEPIVCDPNFTTTLGRGELMADLAGHAEETEFRSTDVEFLFGESDDPALQQLEIDAIDWCKPNRQKSALLLTCRATAEEFAALPLTLDVHESFILGTSMCAVSFTMQAIYKKKPSGSVTIQTLETGGTSGTLSFALGEMTDPDHKLTFSNGVFEAVPDA